MPPGEGRAISCPDNSAKKHKLGRLTSGDVKFRFIDMTFTGCSKCDACPIIGSDPRTNQARRVGGEGVDPDWLPDFNHTAEFIGGTWAACQKLPQSVVAQFQDQGVAPDILEIIRVDKVAWAGSRFEFEAACRSPWSGDAEHALLFLVRDRQGRAIDIVCWDPDTDRLGTWLGAAWAIGQATVLAPRMSEGLVVHRTPLGWLRARFRGVVILDYGRACSYLDAAAPLIAEDRKHRRELIDALMRPAPRILVAPASHPAKEA